MVNFDMKIMKGNHNVKRSILQLEVPERGIYIKYWVYRSRNLIIYKLKVRTLTIFLGKLQSSVINFYDVLLKFLSLTLKKLSLLKIFGSLVDDGLGGPISGQVADTDVVNYLFNGSSFELGPNLFCHRRPRTLRVVKRVFTGP